MQRLTRFLPQFNQLTRPHFQAANVSAILPASHIYARLFSSHYEPGHPLEHPVSVKIEQAMKAPSTPEERWRERSRKANEDLQNRPPSNAYTGRSVPNVSEKRLATSFKVLETILSRNKVRQQLRLSERHEKKGVKRRRLSSERWRKRFADEVRKKVQLVIKIRDRGA